MLPISRVQRQGNMLQVAMPPVRARWFPIARTASGAPQQQGQQQYPQPAAAWRFMKKGMGVRSAKSKVLRVPVVKSPQRPWDHC